MSPINLSILAFAAGALAVPGYRHNHGHQHLHSSYKSGSAVGSASGVPYPAANGTGIYGSTGTGLATGTSVASEVSSAGPATVTVSPFVAIASSSVAVSPVDASSTSSCTSDVTVTTTERTYFTITATGPSPSLDLATVYSTIHITLTSSTSSSTSSSAFPTLSTFAAVAKAHHRSSSSKTTTTSVAPVATSTSVYVAPTTTTKASSAAASSTAAATTGRTGKRGVAYNDASLTSHFTGTEVSWAYNWGSSTTGLASGLNYIPLLWGTASEFTSVWSVNAAAAIKAGSTHLFSFNEPDLSTQANLSPAAAAAAYKTYMQPFAGQAKLCAPSVTNGAGAMGLDWLDAFMTACSGCTIDCVSIHWYDDVSNTAYFKEHVTNATTITGKPVFVSEFAPNDGTAADISTFLDTVMPWLDENDNVAGYAYFMASDGMLVSGSALSSYGTTYNS